MDIQRPASRKRYNQRIVLGGAIAAGALLLGGVAFSLTGRAPGVDAELVWSGEVKQGEFIHEVTAAGSLFAPEIRSISSRSDGNVERVAVLPGHVVGPNDVLVELSSTTLLEELQKGRTALDAAEAEAELQKAKAEDDYLDQQVTLAGIEADYAAAEYESSAQQKLAETKATSELALRTAVMKAETQKRRLNAAREQFARHPQTRAAQEAANAAKLAQQRHEFARVQQQVSDLKVRAGIAGVVQSIAVEAGKRVGAGTEVARIVNPDNLIARVRVSERDAALVQVGQVARLELGRQNLTGKVTRVEPAVQDRLVTVDIELDGEAHAGLRPDLSVTARIEIDRVPDTLVVDRPASLRDDQPTMNLFRLAPDGGSAERVNVGIGRASSRQVEISSGLKAGDRVILADMTEWMEEPEIRIR